MKKLNLFFFALLFLSVKALAQQPATRAFIDEQGVIMTEKVQTQLPPKARDGLIPMPGFPLSFGSNTTYKPMRGLALADLNNDGADEIILCHNEEINVIDGQGNVLWTQALAGGMAQYPAAVGDINKDGIIDETDKTNIGSPLPKFTFGWTNTFNYKNFDLSIFINGSVGNKVMNYTSIPLTSMTSTWNNQIQEKIADRAQLAAIDPAKTYDDGSMWYNDITNVRVTNPGTKTPRVAIGNTYNQNISSRYIEDGSYVRLKNISLGYTFPRNLTKKLYLENLRLYCNLQNVLTITGYDGYDPEIGASTTDANGYVFGLDNGRYPSPFTCTFGINLSF